MTMAILLLVLATFPQMVVLAAVVADHDCSLLHSHNYYYYY
jgi:hypothetical protein